MSCSLISRSDITLLRTSATANRISVCFSSSQKQTISWTHFFRTTSGIWKHRICKRRMLYNLVLPPNVTLNYGLLKGQYSSVNAHYFFKVVNVTPPSKSWLTAPQATKIEDFLLVILMLCPFLTDHTSQSLSLHPWRYKHGSWRQILDYNKEILPRSILHTDRYTYLEKQLRSYEP